MNVFVNIKEVVLFVLFALTWQVLCPLSPLVQVLVGICGHDLYFPCWD